MAIACQAHNYTVQQSGCGSRPTLDGRLLLFKTCADGRLGTWIGSLVTRPGRPRGKLRPREGFSGKSLTISSKIWEFILKVCLNMLLIKVEANFFKMIFEYFYRFHRFLDIKTHFYRQNQCNSYSFRDFDKFSLK